MKTKRTKKSESLVLENWDDDLQMFLSLGRIADFLKEHAKDSAWIK